MDVWEVIYSELQKEKPLTVLFFIFHYYYNRSIKDLSRIFQMRADGVSKSLNQLQGRIRAAYAEDGGLIGKDEHGFLDGHLIGNEVLKD